MAHRFLGSWKRALGELAIVSLGVLLALWADQAMQTRQEATRADADRILERMRTRPTSKGISATACTGHNSQPSCSTA